MLSVSARHDPNCARGPPHIPHPAFHIPPRPTPHVPHPTSRIPHPTSHTPLADHTTDGPQALVGWTGLVVGTGWIMTNMPAAAGISPAYPMGHITTRTHGYL